MAAPPLPPVRLRPEEIAAVKRIVAEHFGPDAEVRVFGSRARLDQRGGDLDLHVRGAGGHAALRRRDPRRATCSRRPWTTAMWTSSSSAPPIHARRIDEVALATGVLL